MPHFFRERFFMVNGKLKLIIKKGSGGTELEADIKLKTIFGAARDLRAEGRACGNFIEN
jgi:hypothetical protein